MYRYLYYILLLLVVVYLFFQVRKPTRWTGRIFLWLMNRSHSGLTDWGLEHVTVGRDFAVLDVGCGGGRTIQKLAGLAQEGKVWGVDYSAESVAASRATNAQLVKEGRVEIRQAGVSDLPFPDDSFDLVTAVETQYYWPDLANDMREILRVLKPGGHLLVIAESYKSDKQNPLDGLEMKLLGGVRLSVEEQKQLFSAAGYAEVQVFEEPKQGWICAMGRKPQGLQPNGQA